MTAWVAARYESLPLTEVEGRGGTSWFKERKINREQTPLVRKWKRKEEKLLGEVRAHETWRRRKK